MKSIIYTYQPLAVAMFEFTVPAYIYIQLAVFECAATAKNQNLALKELNF